MRIYEVTFDGRMKKAEAPQSQEEGEEEVTLEWSSNWETVNVAVADGDATVAIKLATEKLAELPTGKGPYETQPAEVRVLAEV